MNRKLILLVAMFITFRLNGQPPNILWQHSYGGSNYDWSNSLNIDYDGFISAGSTSSNDYDVR